MPQLVLVRHGQSVWNMEDRFTGWTDVDLSERGVAEAKQAARELEAAGFVPDLCFTSYLTRAIRTLDIVLDEMKLMWLPVEKHWRLNERHYGGLQGLNKTEMAAKVGKEQVHVWRRSYDIPPPELEPGDERHPARDSRYRAFDPAMLPRTESLKDTVIRVLPFWHDAIAPRLKEGKRVLVAAHGNSLRGLIKYLDDISDEAIPGLEVPTGSPLLYELGEDLRPKGSWYLRDGRRIPQHS